MSDSPFVLAAVVVVVADVAAFGYAVDVAENSVAAAKEPSAFGYFGPVFADRQHSVAFAAAEEVVV